VKALTLDTGALIAFERNDRFTVGLLKKALEAKVDIVVPAGVVAQAWRDGRRQVQLARLLENEALTIENLDETRAKAAGQLCGVTKTHDVIDASVVLCARTRKHRVLTSEPDDLSRLDPSLDLQAV
jgi:predicted nucleic acid-binding protein